MAWPLRGMGAKPPETTTYPVKKYPSHNISKFVHSFFKYRYEYIIIKINFPQQLTQSDLSNIYLNLKYSMNLKFHHFYVMIDVWKTSKFTLKIWMMVFLSSGEYDVWVWVVVDPHAVCITLVGQHSPVASRSIPLWPDTNLKRDPNFIFDNKIHI